MSDRNGVYQSLVDEYEAHGLTYEEASKLAILNLKYQYDYEKVNLSEEEHKRMGTGGINWWEKIKQPTESTSPKIVTKTEKYQQEKLNGKT